MRRISEELNRLGKKYRILRLADLRFPLKKYPKYIMILFLDIMQHRDDLIYGLCVLEEFTRAGVTVIPPIKGLYYSDKFSNYLLCNRYLRKTIQMPDTLCSINLEVSKEFLQQYKRLIFKPISGSMGIGIEIVETENRLKELQDQYHALFLQEIIPDRGYDIRTFVIGDQIVAQYARYNSKSFLKNIHLGAVPKSIDEMMELDPDIQSFADISREIAKEIRKVAELEIIGVDTLPSKKDGQVYLIEWNSVPGFRGAEEATGVNVAGEIVNFLFKD
ncbi:MAG: ATP-grasp domain-containing protein [Candidatus Helarchaeota archaeon]|nr:ATP-grasp domain-containing protein [Candidatus Helarchaeota archaeon]